MRAHPIVEINSFVGTIEEVGVRTTKLKGRGENIKIIANRDISNVVNRIHLNSWCIIELGFNNESLPMKWRGKCWGP